MIALCLATICLAVTHHATAQITSLADDIIILTQGVDKQEQMKADAHLANPAGSGGNPFGYARGSGDRRLGPHGIPAPGSGVGRVQSDVLAEQRPRRPQTGPPKFCDSPRSEFPCPADRRCRPPWQMPDDAEDEGPTSGLTLDDAISLLVRANYDLRHQSPGNSPGPGRRADRQPAGEPAGVRHRLVGSLR